MKQDAQAYGLWPLVIVNAAVFTFFAFSFTKPTTKREWRALGAFAAFIAALFAEMYGFPLTIYLLSGWLGRRYPQLDLFSHDAGHLLDTLIGWTGNAHWSPLHIASNVLIGLGFVLLASAWSVLHRAQQTGTLAGTGPYARIRHPQYDAFVLIMFGFLLQWPTLLTVAMFPVLVVMYWRLAKREEGEMEAEFGTEYLEYAARTPRFFPSVRRTRRMHGGLRAA